MNRFLIGAFITITIAMIALAAGYPEDFALSLGAFVLGALLGSVAAYYVFVSIHDKGFERSQQLSLRQVVNPASFAREMRLADKEVAPRQEMPQQPIPQFNLKGLTEQ